MLEPEDTTQSQLNVLNRLVEISLVLNSSLSIEHILTQLMDASAEVLNAESASVILLDPNTNELHFVALSSKTEHTNELIRIPVPLRGSLAGSIIRENRTIILNDVSQDPRHFRTADDKSGFQTRSLLGVPMRIKNRVIGALEAVNKKGDHWEEHDAHYLQVLASQAAIALENAQLVDKLQKANKELSQVDKLKSDFISIASHELRTPLGVIMGYASFLQQEAQGEMSEHAAAVLNSALHMRSLIEDMTNLRFLELGESELQLEPMSVTQLIELTKSDVLDIAVAKGHTVTFAPANADINMRVDRGKIVMALGNLLNNAIKFTPPQNGKILVECRQHENELWIRVTDNGVGIPEDDMQDIFRPFHQVEDHMTRHHGGMGLGLSIAKSVIEAHRGRIWAESPGPNQGSTFTVALPIPPAAY